MRAIRLTSEQIESWVARHFDYKRRKNGEELLICNPFILGDTKYKFNISTIAKQSRKSNFSNYWVHDWRPSAQQYSGSFLKFVQRYKGLGFKDALKDICGQDINLKEILAGATIYKTEPKEIRRIALPKSSKKLVGDDRLGKIAQNYLLGRGITQADITSFRLHYTPTMVIFPYIEYDEIVYWQGRTFSTAVKQFEFPDERKFGIGKSQFVYGFDNAEPGQPAYIVEAIFCALTVGPGALATGGATMSEIQVRKLRALNPSSVVLAPDDDEEGWASIYKNWKLLNPYFKIQFVLPPSPHKDWNAFVKCATDKAAATTELREYIRNNTRPLTMTDAIKYRIKR